jgi:hypothetical protein
MSGIFKSDSDSQVTAPPPIAMDPECAV